MAETFRAFGQKFILMDDRSFRSVVSVNATNEQTLYGTDQEKWLFTELAADASPAWIMNGFQFFGGYHSFES